MMIMMIMIIIIKNQDMTKIKSTVLIMIKIRTTIILTIIIEMKNQIIIHN